MDIQRTQSVSPTLSAERIAAEQTISTIKLSNDLAKQEGQASLALIQAAASTAPLPAPTATTGNNINIRV